MIEALLPFLHPKFYRMPAIAFDQHSLVPLSSGSQMPSVGLGLWKIDKSVTASVVSAAIDCGYRHIDAACDYGNETEAGLGIREAVNKRICSRTDLWVTSKLWNTYHRPEHVQPALERTLADLGLDYIDLYLIHFPIATKHVAWERRYPPGWFYDPQAANPQMIPDPVPLADTWGALERQVEAGRVRHIGVSNFGTSLIRDLLSYCRIRPSVLQVESHPYLTQSKLLRFCQLEQIAFTAFSPLGAGSYVSIGMADTSDSVLNDPVIAKIAKEHEKTCAQIVLRWAIQRGTAAVPKTSRVEKLRENLDLFQFQLTDQEMHAITSLNRNLRFNDPGVFCEQAFQTFFPIYE